MVKNQRVTFALVCIVLLAPRRSETRATKGREVSEDSPDQKYIVLAESIMTNPHNWLHWRKLCHSSLQTIRNQFFSFSCSVPLFLFFFLFFYPWKQLGLLKSVCYKLEDSTVNFPVLKPASAFFMNPYHSETAS